MRNLKKVSAMLFGFFLFASFTSCENLLGSDDEEEETVTHKNGFITAFSSQDRTTL